MKVTGEHGRVSRVATSGYADRLWETTEKLRSALGALRFGGHVHTVYNPLVYAAELHRQYLERYGAPPKRVLFLGMNPGPFGMAQTGIPFGTVSVVREWLLLYGRVAKPPSEHPKRPVLGMECPREEVSGARLWGLFRQRFGRAEEFFREHFVVNFCPLAFLEETGRNITPDKLPAGEREELLVICREALGECLKVWNPEWVIGVGRFALRQAELTVRECSSKAKVGTILHPSPASPQANQNWGAAATRQLEQLGVW